MHNNIVLRRSGFSLVEVVVAVGIFALAIVGVIGLLGPTTKNITEVSDGDAATRVIGAIQSGLQSQGFTAVQTAINGNTVYYATRSGDKIGTATTLSTPADRFFSFTLIRNTDLSPAANDTTSGYLAFTISLKWPAYLPNGTQVTSTSAQNSMIVPAAVTR